MLVIYLYQDTILLLTLTADFNFFIFLFCEIKVQRSAEIDTCQNKMKLCIGLKKVLSGKLPTATRYNIAEISSISYWESRKYEMKCIYWK